MDIWTILKTLIIFRIVYFLKAKTFNDKRQSWKVTACQMELVSDNKSWEICLRHFSFVKSQVTETHLSLDSSSSVIFYGPPEKSGSCCVIHRKEVKNIMCARSPCGRRRTRREEGRVFEVTHGFSQHRRLNISLAFSSLEANSWALPVTPFPAALGAWFVFDLKFAARLFRWTEKLVTLELQCSNSNPRCVLRSGEDPLKLEELIN